MRRQTLEAIDVELEQIYCLADVNENFLYVSHANLSQINHLRSHGSIKNDGIQVLHEIERKLTTSIDEFHKYADAYIIFVKSLSPATRFFGRHGSTGITRAERSKYDFSLSTKTAIKKALNEKLIPLLESAQTFSEKNLSQLFNELIHELLDMAKKHCVGLEGGLHNHSYKTYLLAYIFELEQAVTQTLNQENAPMYRAFELKTLDKGGILRYPLGDNAAVRKYEFEDMKKRVLAEPSPPIKPVF